MKTDSLRWWELFKNKSQQSDAKESTPSTLFKEDYKNKYFSTQKYQQAMHRAGRQRNTGKQYIFKL